MGNTIVKGTEGAITEYAGKRGISKEDFRKACIKYVQQQLRGRHQNNVLNDEVDFFAGAISAMMVVNEVFFDSRPEDVMDICPPMWLIGPMAGRSYVGKKKRDGSVTYGEWI